MTNEQLFDIDTLPCGCVLSRVIALDGTRELRLSPCRPGCTVVADLVRMAQEDGKPVERRLGS